MDLLKSVVFAAVVSGVVGLIVALISARTALRINKDKIKLDRQLAEKRDIAERENLARKFNLERQTVLLQKKAELAEKVLHDFHQIAFTIELIRSPMIQGYEMVPEEGVPDDVVRDPGYGVIRRMLHYRSRFDDLETFRFKCAALFEPEAVEIFSEIVKIYNEIWFAAKAILENRDEVHDRDFIRDMRRVAFSVAAIDPDGNPMPDLIKARCDGLIARVEGLCRPYISQGALNV